MSYRAAIAATHQRVAQLLALGMTNKQIARDLQMSEGGIKYHVGQVLKELNASNRTQAAVRMHERAL